MSFKPTIPRHTQSLLRNIRPSKVNRRHAAVKAGARPPTEVRGMARDVAAVVVTYRPAASTFRNLRLLASQIRTVYVIDNTPKSAARHLFQQIRSIRGVRLVRLGLNTGIGAALNLGMELARIEGFNWVITLDQDSTLPNGAAKRLRRGVISDEVGLVASQIRDAFSNRLILRKADSLIHQKREVVITSGNLVRIEAWMDVGGFDWRFFLDSVDFDFCLRLAKAGWQVRRSEDVTLMHRLGRPRKIKCLGFRLTVRSYPPFRRYFQARNGVTVVRRHVVFAPLWSLEHSIRLLLVWLKIVLVERKSRLSWTKGLIAGLENRDSGIKPLPIKGMRRNSTLRTQERAIQKTALRYRQRMAESSDYVP